MVGAASARGAPEIEDESGRHNVRACGTRDGGGGWSAQRVCVWHPIWRRRAVGTARARVAPDMEEEVVGTERGACVRGRVSPVIEEGGRRRARFESTAGVGSEQKLVVSPSGISGIDVGEDGSGERARSESTDVFSGSS